MGKLSSQAFQVGSLGGVALQAPLLCLPLGSRGTAPEKKFRFDVFALSKISISAFFSSFSNAFWLHLMILKWDQKKVRLAIYPSWKSLCWVMVEYLNHDEWKYCQIYWLMEKSKTRIIRQYTFIQTLHLWYFTK